MSVLVVLEHDRGTAAKASWEALTAGRTLAESLGVPMEALVIGADGRALAGEAGEYGATVVHVAAHAVLSDYGPEAWGETAAQAAVLTGAVAVVSVGTDRGNEVLAQAAARMDQAMVANVIDVEVGEFWEMTRLRWGGSLRERAALTSPIKMVTFAPHVIEPSQAPVASEVREFEPTLDESHAGSVIVDREVVSEGITLATAPVVVGGGRGVGSAEAFSTLEELAELLGGVVGCSRVVTNNGWRPHTDQVGQTGTRIAPKLYIACGISGAIQHWVGAANSKKILAINTDPEANMVAKADYAVIGDLHQVVPAITEELRRRSS
jgi:electron transfer flavoprotein alpha subunit